MTPAQQLADVFVALAGGTADGPPDVAATLSVLAHRSPALLGVDAAAVVYAPGEGETRHVAGSGREVSRLERDAEGRREGPGHDSRLAHGLRVQAALGHGPVRQRWPHYAPRALALGYTRVAALPLRERPRPVGALVLLAGGPRSPFPEDTLALGQSLADFTSAVLRRAREAERSRALTSQLEQALTSRVIVEQAKGILAARWAVTVDDAFTRLRGYARARQRSLHDVAREVVEGRADPGLTGE